MSIVAYTGLPGSGKSYGVVENVVLPALKSGRVVVTNLALKLDVIELAYPGADVRPFDLDGIRTGKLLLHDVAVAGCVLVIDEVQKLWPSGTTAKNANPQHLAFMTEHRHRVDAADNSTQIVLCTQDLANVATFLRSLVEYTFRSVKLGSLGLSTRFRIDVYQGPATGPKPPAKDIRRRMTGKYQPSIYRFYSTHTQSEGQGSANEAAIDGRMVIWKSPLFFLGVPVLLIVLIGGSFKLWNMFHPEPKPNLVKPGQRALVSSPPTGRTVQTSPPGQKWHIAVDMRGGSGDVVYFSDGEAYAAVRTADYCDRDASGFLLCRWEGQRLTNRFKQLPVAVAAAVPDYRFGAASPPAGVASGQPENLEGP